MIQNLYRQFRSLLNDDDGPTAVEYAVMTALIAAFCMASILLVSQAAAGKFDGAAAIFSN